MANVLGGPVKLPPDFDLQGQNAAAEWKFWKTTFEDYLVATGQRESTDIVKLSILRNIIGIDAARTMSTFAIPDNETNKYKSMLEIIEKYVNHRVNECFERYTFLKRIQKEGEPFEHFLTDCRHLVKSCNYNTIDPNESNEDKALRDKIVMGIKDPTTREALLRIDQLSMDKAVNFCWTSEQSKQQSMRFQEEEAEINYIKKQNSGEHKITTKENFEAVCHPPTKVPIKIRNELKTELQRLVDRKAISKVDEMKPNASVNTMVIVEKPSVFDLSEGYHHLVLTEESSWKCCFATPFGIFRFTVLPFGLSNSQDLFQEEVEKHFGDIENVQICHDDMIVSGKTKEEHDKAVLEIVTRARQVKAKFNKDKFQYCQDKVKFMGQIFSEIGMQIDPDRIESLCKLEIPKNKVELQRILGSFNYVRRYVKNMSSIMHPLYKLLKSNSEWCWLPKHQETFDKLKQIISQAPALVPFDPKRKIVLQCDASKNGIGCCMFQQHENNMLKLVACASRTMNDHEINYSQTEKELLAIQYDMLSRSSLKTEKYNDPEMLKMIHSITTHLPMSNERKDQFRQETNKDITVKTCSPHYHQSNGLAEKAVSIGKQILRKSIEDNYDYREGVLEYNNSPIIHLDASPAQILQSRNLRTQLPITSEQFICEPELYHSNIQMLDNYVINEQHTNRNLHHSPNNVEFNDDIFQTPRNSPVSNNDTNLISNNDNHVLNNKSNNSNNQIIDKMCSRYSRTVKPVRRHNL
ncbi:uncharacterized protein LOC122510924 [Leptopilina heterotoma]|uniref:uncharacterized protein LOC122510924 n=1 Tax=Leptopilina heterotoma TaxID=63436 RepID=UPI001CAA1494|nr:uncharacterized protein LOC122510924 [Leptopilina heterotoma]